MREAGVPTKDRGDNVGANFVNICCPFCGELRYHLGINLKEHWFKCLMCGEGGAWYTLARELRTHYPQVDWFSLKRYDRQSRYLDEETLTPQIKREIAKLSRPFKFVDGYLCKEDCRAWKYLTEKRQLAPEIIDYAKIGQGIGKLRGHVTFVDGEFVAARRYSGTGPSWFKQGSATRPYGAAWVRRIKPLWAVITEGVFDVLSVPLGYAIGMFGITLSTKWIDIAMEALPDTEAIIIGLDRGVSSRTISTLMLMFGDCGYKVYRWNWTDPLFDGIKDLDEVRLRFGSDWLRTRLLEIVGQGADDSESLSGLL